MIPHRALALVLAVLFGVLPALAASAPVQLPPRAVALFRSLGVRIALPHYVPQGYHVAQYGVQRPPPGRASGIGTPEYFVLYRRGIDECFVFESGNGGLGGPDVSMYRKIIVRSAFLGNPPLEYDANTFFILGVDERTRDGRWYDITSIGNPGYYTNASGCTKGPSTHEAVRIGESIGYI